MKFNKGFALYAIVGILLVILGSIYNFGELVSTLLIFGIVWVTIYVALVKKLF